MSKDAISRNYMDIMKLKHANKPYKDLHRIAVNGTIRRGSIGKAIFNSLSKSPNVDAIFEFYGDVREENQCRFDSETDVLILCHGALHVDWLENAPMEKVKEVVDVNLTGTINMIQQFVRSTIEAPHKKKIISIGSMAYRNVLNGSAAYCASKAGLAHYIRCAAWELAPKGYDVYCVHPSNTEGAPMSEDTIQGIMRYRNLDRKSAEAYWGAVLPREKWLQPNDIADVVKFLVEGNSAYMSGSQIDLGGGQR
jgi:NAD(P)-dependent dehydrogenase (short-subunit alcohol dehydrogenase family)